MNPPVNGLASELSVPTYPGAPGQPVQVDFSQVEDAESFVTIPEGTYRVRIAEVREGQTKSGHLRWSLRLEVSEGEFAGRTAAWDGLAWTERGLMRVKHVLAVLGFDTSGALEVQAAELLGREAEVTFFVEEWEDPNTHRRVERLAVPFLGYERIDPHGPGDSPF